MTRSESESESGSGIGIGSVRIDVPDADAMQALGRELAAVLAAGDLVLLVGPLGAGKTTLTRGIGEGLRVRGAVTSPTFVIARHHPVADPDGTPLLHVDAYRLGSFGELDDLDLDTSLDECVTVVEWGEGLAEPLSEHRLEVRIDRAVADTAPATLDSPRDLGDSFTQRVPGEGMPKITEGVPKITAAGADAEDGDGADPRVVTLTGVGERWRGVALPTGSSTVAG
jgi:tRNA threonylcarbamoyladenosine biosynthesis protein TsaE